MASPLLFLLGVALVISQPIDTCNFTYNGYNFDLNGMYLPPSQGDYHGDDRDEPYLYVMNVCGSVNVGGPCSESGSILCQYLNNSIVASVAYQLATPYPVWNVLSPADPTKGVTLTASNGELCYPTNYPRNVTFTFNCDLEASLDGRFTVWEDSNNDCSYHVDYTHPNACPLPNNLQPIVNGVKTDPMSLNKNDWAYWVIYVDDIYAELKVTVRQSTDDAGWVGVWARRGAPPTSSAFDRYDNTGNTHFHELEIRTTDNGNPLLPGNWYIGVQAQNSLINSFTVQADLMYCPANCSNNGNCNPATKTCQCSFGYVSNQKDCSALVVDANLNTSYVGGIFGNHWIFYRFDINDSSADEMYFVMTRATQTPASLPVLAIKYQDWPTSTSYDAIIRDTSCCSQRWELSIEPPVLQNGVWIAGISGSPDQPFNYTLSVNICDCPKCCSGHGSCVHALPYDQCVCDAGYAGTDCSANTIEISTDMPVNVTVDANGGVRYVHVSVPAEIALSHVDMEVNANLQGTPGNAGIRLYAAPVNIPVESNYEFVSAFPDGNNPQLVIPHADLQAPSWYIAVWNYANTPAIVQVSIEYEGWCPCVNGHGECTEGEPATCVCDSKWQGAACDIAVSSGSSDSGVEVGAVVAMVIIFTLLGVGAGIFIKHKRPELCERGGVSGGEALVNAD